MEKIIEEKCILGIEFGSTRIKAVLIDEKANVLAQGSFEWVNTLADGLWSYPMELVEKGLQASYAELNKQYKSKYGEYITALDGIGISAMMHGYLAFDEKDNLLAPFRTWRNTNTEQAAKELSELFKFNVPMRWSVSQYYQSVLDKLDHVKNIKFMTTLAGYVHYRLTGKKVLGIDDASGMFPCDSKSYDKAMMKKFNALLESKGIHTDYESVLPKVMLAGENAGKLTEQGAKWLDPTGKLKAGAILCPPEGDMGTGMIATNSVSPRTGNVSSGTAANMTIILEKPLKNYYREIDIVSTPDGHPSALIHTNNCTTEINEWVNLFNEVIELAGGKINKGELYTKLFNKSKESDGNVGGMVGYNYLAGEPLAQTINGAPMLARRHDGKLDLANFMQMQIYSAIAALSIGMDILQKENVGIDRITAHGGFYKTDFIGQNATSAILNAPVTVMQNASEGGAWGIAILALYALDNSKPLGQFLGEIFKNAKQTTVMASDDEKEKCDHFLSAYKKALIAERLLSEVL